MLDPKQFRTRIIRPVLVHLELWSEAAEELLLGTALQESRLKWLRQLGGGPARGLYQMEPATHADIHGRWLTYRPALKARVEALLAPAPDALAQLESNLAYATAMTRLHYRRVPKPLPAAGDIAGHAAYWKAFYNTPLGAGTVREFIHNWERLT